MIQQILSGITHPTLLLDKQKAFNNIQMMIRKANKYNLAFRPHFKTHQSAKIGNWFRDLGVDEITVSSLNLAKYFVGHGWKKVIVAFPVNARAVEEINELAKRCSLTVFISNKDSLNKLKESLTSQIQFFIEIDTGYNRTGISPENTSFIDELLQIAESSNQLKFRGFYAHNGHTYHASSKAEIEEIHTKTVRIFWKLRKQYSDKYPKLDIQIGDTPSCSLLDHFEGIDAIGPGNFVFYDLTQANIGSCNIDQVAVAMACPVVEKYEDKNQVIIHGGGVHFSKDFIEEEDGTKVFGRVVKMQDNDWSEPIENAYITSLSQEHGIVQIPKELMSEIKVGDLIFVLPVHSCLTANLYQHYFCLDGECIERFSS
ncbi:MAG: alanine racemase [Thalassobius sp.]|nr:alanine racemase [Thalassovita sp.]